MTKTSLPYSNATSGDRAIADLQQILRRFGCTQFGTMIDDEAGELIVQFKYHGRQVSVRASMRGYAALWLKENPYTSRRRSTKVEHERKALDVASTAVYSIARDWIKGQIMAIESGMLTFEAAFLGQILLADGRTVMEHVDSQKLLPAPGGEK